MPPRREPSRLAAWWQITKRAWQEAGIDQVPLMVAGVAFFGFLSLFPAMIPAVMTYGLVADPAQIQDQVTSLSDALPADAQVPEEPLGQRNAVKADSVPQPGEPTEGKH